MSDNTFGILGHEFYRGPEISLPEWPESSVPMDDLGLHLRRMEWLENLRASVREHNAWGVLVVMSNEDHKLYGADGISLMMAVKAPAMRAVLILERRTPISPYSRGTLGWPDGVDVDPLYR